MKTYFEKLLLTIVILGPGLVFGFMGKPTEMGIAIVAGAILAAFINIDKIQKFKGAGFEAEMKAEVQKAVEEAYATVENLKEVTTPLIITLLDNMTYAGRWGGISLKMKLDLMDELEKSAEALKFKNGRLDESVERFYQQHTWDLVNKFTGHMIRLCKDEAQAIQIRDLNNRDSNAYPTRKQIKVLTSSISVEIDEEATELLEDYLYFIDKRKLRR